MFVNHLRRAAVLIGEVLWGRDMISLDKLLPKSANDIVKIELPCETHVGAAVAAGNGNGALGAGLLLAAAVVGKDDVGYAECDDEDDLGDVELHLRKLLELYVRACSGGCWQGDWSACLRLVDASIAVGVGRWISRGGKLDSLWTHSFV